MAKKLPARACLLSVLCLMSACALMHPVAALGGGKADTQFYFVQVTDTHFGVNNNEKRVQKTVDAINRLPMTIEFVAQTGDITEEKLEDGSVVANALNILGELEAPVHHVPGNHDVLRRKHELTARIYKKNFGEFITQRECHGVLCLFVYTEPLAKNFKVPGYDPLKELDEILRRSGGKPVLIFHHTPCVSDFYRNRMHSGWREDVREQWIKLINAHNVKGVFAGHFHRDEFHWLGNVPLYVSSSVGDTMRRGRQTTYRIYEYRDGRIGYRTQYIK